MKKVGKFIVAAIVIDYIRVAAYQSYTILMRMLKKNESQWEAIRKTGPSWKDEVVFHEELEEEV